MPDVKEFLKKYQVANDAIEGGTQPTEDPQTDPKELLRKKRLKQSAMVAGDEKDIRATMKSNALIGAENTQLGQPLEESEGWSADRAYQNFFDKSADNFMYGLGTWSKSLGDVVQGLQGLITDDWSGNALSKVLQEVGTDLEENYETYVSEEMKDPKFSLISTYMNPEFYAVHGARFLPQLLEILATYGAATGVRKGLQWGAQKALKDVAKKAGKATTKTGVFKGTREGVEEVVGSDKGLFAKMLTDEAKFTKNFGQLLETTTAGSLTNLRVSLGNAGEMYNTYKDLEDEYGNKAFTNEEVAEMAAGAFTNNMQYMAMDILSWGMTFGKTGFMKGMTPKIGAEGIKNVKSAFMKQFKPWTRNLAKWGFKGTREGAEEMIQESWEEWSKIEAYRDKYGSLEGYEGKITQDYKKGVPGFWEYLNSSDSEAIRTIAFGMGGIAGGAFNVKTLFNREATKARKMRDRMFALEQQGKDLNMDEKTAQRYQIAYQIGELVFDGKSEHFAGFINKLQQRGAITEEEVQQYTELHDILAEDAEAIQNLDSKGKRAIMGQAIQQRHLQSEMGLQEELHNKRLQWINENVLTQAGKKRAIKKENESFLKQAQGLAYGIARSIKNKQNILFGKKAEDITMKPKDPDNQSAVEGTEIKVPENFKANEDLRQIYEQVFQQVMSEPEVTQEEQQQTQAGNMQEMAQQEAETLFEEATNDPEAFLEELTEGDEILIDGKKAKVTNINPNIGGAIDNFDYEMEFEKDPDSKSENITTEEEVKSRRGNIRYTKKGTFFNDRNNRQSVVQKAVKPEEPGEATGVPVGRESRPDEKPTETQKKKADDFFAPYENVKPNLKAKKLTPNRYKKWQETREIESGILVNIAIAIANNDIDKLSKEEKEIFHANTEVIGAILDQMRVENAQELMMANLDEETKAYVKEASERKAKKESLQDETNKKLNDDTNTRSLSEKAKEKAGEVFQASKDFTKRTKKDVKEIWRKLKQALNGEDITPTEEATTEPEAPNVDKERKIAEQGKNLIDRIKKGVMGITDKIGEIGAQYMSSQRRRFGYWEDWKVMETMAINDALERIYPDQKPRAYILDNLYNGLGVRAVGYAVGSAVFIEEGKWEQDRIFMHEMSHVHFNLTKDSLETMNLLNLALENRPLVEDIVRRYDDQIMYRIYNRPPEKGVHRRSKLITKKELIPNYELMSPQQRMDYVTDLERKGMVKVLPLKQQPVITEEVFVATVEGPLSVRYNKFFEERFDLARKGRVKRWWTMLKKKALEARTPNTLGERSLLKALSQEQRESYEFSKQAFIDGFVQETRGYGVDPSGRMNRIQDQATDVLAQQLEIREKRVANQKEWTGKKNKPLPEQVEMMKETQREEAMEIGPDEAYDPEQSFDFDALAYVDRASKLIRQFNTAYGIAQTKRFFLQNAGKKINVQKMPYYDGDQLFIALNELAHQAPNADEFIRIIENSEIEELFEFNKFLDKTRPDKYTVLSNMFHLNRNQHHVNGVKVFISPSGNIDIQQSTNYTEKAMIENQKTHIIDTIGGFIKRSKNKQPMPEHMAYFANVKQAASNIRKNKFTDGDIRTILRFFGGPKVKVDKIMNRGFLNFKGKTLPIDQAVYGFLTTDQGFANDSVYYPGGKRIMRRGVIDFIEGIVATNRPFTAEYTTTDANNNLKPARQINNALLSITKEMEGDILGKNGNQLTRNQFLQKYGHHTRGLTTGKLSNALLNKIYDDVINGGNIAINTYDGTVNQQTAKQGTIKDSNPDEHSFTEMVMYFSSRYQYGTDTDSYLMELGRMSDSPRSFIMEVPRQDIKTMGRFDANGKFIIDKRKPAIVAAYQINKKAGYEGTIEQYVDALTNEIRSEINFVKENSSYASKLGTIQNLFEAKKVKDPNTGTITEVKRLSKNGAMQIAEYVMNQHLNGSYFMETFLPSYQGTNVVKRAKSLTSPYFKVGENTKMEGIPILDPANELGVEVNDGAIYMRESDIERVRKLGGNFMDIGYGLKGLHSGIEYDNPAMKNKNMYIKGYIFPLSEEIVAQNPALKGVWDLLNARAKKYEERTGGYEMDLQSTLESHLPYAYHVSADKAKMMPSSFNRKLENGATVSENFDLLNIGDNDQIHDFLDEIYYEKGVVDGNESWTYNGLSGNNFGVQLTMDKESYSSNVSVQLLKAITTNAAINGNIELAEQIQQFATELMQENLAKIDSVFQEGNPEKIKKLIQDHMNLAEMDPIQAQAILVDMLSFNTPELRIIARNQLANIVRLNGNKLRAPGTIAQQKPDHYAKKYNTGDSETLAWYHTPEENSKEYADIQKYETGRKPETKIFRHGTKPSETVVPGYMRGDGVMKRMYVTLDDIQGRTGQTKTLMNEEVRMVTVPKTVKTVEEELRFLRDYAKQVALKRGSKLGMVYDKQGKVKGFYVEGTKMIQTRIPAHGPQTTGVFEVIDFAEGKASNVQTPWQFSLKTTGGDFDGDMLFIQHAASKKTSPKWAGFMNLIENHWLTPEMQAEVKLAIDHKPMVEAAEATVAPINENNLHWTPAKRRQDFHNTRSTSNGIGIVANAHSLIGLMSAYDVNFNDTVRIKQNSVETVKNTFQDEVRQGQSRTINSANLFQVILDNASDQSAQTLGINMHTAVMATVLINLGFDMPAIAQILRSPAVEMYSQLKAKQENNYNDRYIPDVAAEVANRMKVQIPKEPTTIDLDKDLGSKKNTEAILRMVKGMEKLNSDFMRINGILGQHNAMPINPFQLQEQMKDFNDAMDNTNNATINITEGFKQNPIVQNYINTANILESILEKMDPVYRPQSAKLHEVVVEGAPRNLNKSQKEKLYNLLELFHTSRSLGYNNIPQSHLKSLTAPNHPNNIFDRVAKHMVAMERNIVVYDEIDPNNSITELQSSVLFSKLLNMQLKGRNQFIGLNTGFYKENVDPNLKRRASEEFNQLPADLKNDLILYDLMVNGFKSGQSIFPILPNDFRQTVSDAADADISQKFIEKIPQTVMQKLLSAILRENPEFSKPIFTKVSPFVNTKNGTIFNKKWLDLAQNKKIKDALQAGKPFYFNMNNKLYYFQGGRAFQQDMRNIVIDKKLKWNRSQTGDRYDAAVEVAFKHTKILPLTPSNYNEGIIGIEDGEIQPYFEWNRDQDMSNWKQYFDQIKEGVPVGRESREGVPETGYWKYHNLMSRPEFDAAMKYDIGVQDYQKQLLYDSYTEEYNVADKAYRTVINEETVKKMSDEKLLEHFDTYGRLNKFAYAKVMRPIVLEITNRNINEQVTEYNGQAYDKKDITVMQKLMMSNNVPSNHPAAQAAIRKLEGSYKEYQVERTRMLSKINKATDALYQEKFGFKTRDGNWKDWLKSIYYSIANILQRDKFYNRLYGNLIDVKKTKGPDGQELTKIKYKSKEVIEEGYKNESISEAEYNFYNETRAIMEEMRPHVVKNGPGRADYIPHVAPDLMEKLSRRGLLGALVHSKSINEQIYDVTMDFVNPITGEMETGVNFKYIQDVYNALSAQKNVPLSHTKDFYLLKKKAYDLYKTGKNQDGTPIRYSNITTGSAIGDVFMNEFSGRNGISAQDLPTFDLNKAFNDYVTSALYVHGNGKFAGMKKMLPIVDGVIAQANRDNNPNLEKYMDTIWRKYFLAGTKQQTLPNSTAALAAGFTTDEVIDFITKGSLMYWLGWKGLAIGKGVYAIGNVVVGKYHNVKNRSGKEWAKGEKRFWYGKSGKFDIKDPMRGTRESAQILKNIGFLDINIYDEVHASKKNSLDSMLENIALSPMVKGEEWIQGVHFLGMLTDQEWDHIKNGGRLSWDRLNALEDEVKKSHGKGYQPTDQRMIQMYSWGRAILQFSRYLPTMAYDRLAKADIDRYGNLHIGAYTAVWEPIQKMVTGNMKTSEFKQYYDSLDPEQKRRFRSGLKGFGMMTLLLGSQQVLGRSEYADDLFWDANAIFNLEKLKWKMTPPSYDMMENLLNF